MCLYGALILIKWWQKQIEFTIYIGLNFFNEIGQNSWIK